MPVSSARAAAFDILLRVQREGSYASELLHSTTYNHLSKSDHALTTELVMGVLRWRSRLDDEVATASSQPLSRLDLEILTSLRLALYQLRWLDRIPQHAALHESVELVKRARKRSAVAFVNAVLRKLSVAPKNTSLAVNRDSTPEDLAAKLAHPSWLVERWIKQYGFSAAQAICEHDQSVPPTVIRLRTPDAEAELRQMGVSLADGALLSTARRVTSGDVARTETFRNCQVAIQDEASQLVAALVGRASSIPTPSHWASSENRSGNGLRILDCCAAPGGKTLAIADRSEAASVTAVELHPHRARLLRKLIASGRAGRSSAPMQIIAADARFLPTSSLFDRVLADVPCSGTGTLARNPEIKWRLASNDLTDLRKRQSAILRSAMHRVAPRGRLIYSTCSLETEENEDVIEDALAADNSFQLVDCLGDLVQLKAEGELSWTHLASLTRGPYLRTIPGIHPCDGFFAAILEKS
jgi:16S rRNA (cytosine967-C5)-methyltransferase